MCYHLLVARGLELAAAYWMRRTGSARPSPEQVLDLLVLESRWSDDEDHGVEVFDFTLPGEVTQYLLSVRVAESGMVEAISMEWSWWRAAHRPLPSGGTGICSPPSGLFPRDPSERTFECR